MPSYFAVAVALLCTAVVCQSTPDMFDTVWVLSSQPGTHTQNVPLFGNASLQIVREENDRARIHLCFPPSYHVSYGLSFTESIIETEDTRLFYENLFAGLEYIVGATREVSPAVNHNASYLEVVMNRPLATSQRLTWVREIHQLNLDVGTDGSPVLSYTVERSYDCEFLNTGSKGNCSVFRNDWLFVPSDTPSGFCVPPTTSAVDGSKGRDELLKTQRETSLKAARRETHEAFRRSMADLPSPQVQKSNLLSRPGVSEEHIHYVLYINDTWSISAGGLNANAFILGVQGLANRDRSTLYIIYPPDWAWTDTLSIFNFYNSSLAGATQMHFVVLRHLDDVLDTFYGLSDSYVYWDQRSRESLLAGFTLSGVSDSFLINSQDMLDAINRRRPAQPLSLSWDLTGTFNNLTTAESSLWLYDQAWANVSKDYIVYIGGDEGDTIHPGVADWAVARRTFTCDLSTSPRHFVDEYNVSVKLLSSLNPDYFLMGWHPYGKDQEHDFTSLASRTKGTVEGLNTQPNFSFNYKVPLPQNFTFKANHAPVPHTVEDQVYITLVQTDGLGLGAWTKPGRGELVYNWEVTLPDLVLQPAVVRFFYSQATPNDYFTAALGGPGYMYPKAVPPSYLPHQLKRAQSMMKELDLENLIIFDSSQCLGPYTTTGDTNIPSPIVRQYCENIPNGTGFLNGYTASFTFSHCGRLTNTSDEKVFMSFDYYVDQDRADRDVIADLKQLMRANPIRPYFLALHVREFNTEARMKQIISDLNAEEPVEIVSADVFLKLAGKKPTFREHFH